MARISDHIRHPKRRMLLRRLAILASLAFGSAAYAAGPGGYPNRVVTLVVPFAAGNTSDIYCRMIAEKLEKRIGQPIVIENKPGANSILGTAFVARSRPDGYVFLYGTNSSLSSAPGLFKNLPYDPVKDFSGIAITVESYFALMVAPQRKDLTLAQYLDTVRKAPGDHPWGGASTSPEIIAKEVQNAGKLSNTYIRYGAASALWNDLLGGRLSMALMPISVIQPYVQAGTAHALAVSSEQRLPAYADIPTIAETLPGVSLKTWTGFFAPAGTPKPVLQYLYDNLAEVLKDPEIAKRNSENGRGLAMPPAEVDAFVKGDVGRWNDVLKKAGIPPS